MSAVSNAKVTANLHLPHPDEELLKPSGANLQQCPPVQKIGGCFESQAVLKLSANLKLCHTGQAVSFYRVMIYLVVVRIVRHEAGGHPHLDIFLSRSSKQKGVRSKTASENLLQEKLVKKSEAALISAVLFLATQRIRSCHLFGFSELAASSKSQAGIRFLYKKPTNQGTLQVPTIASRTF